MSTIQPRTAVITIYQGDYLDRIRHLERKYEAALKAEGDTPRVLSDESQASSLAEQHEALVAEAEDSAIDVTVTALGRRAWRALVAEHPARDGNKGDADLGVNEDTFKDALVAASVDLTDEDLDLISDVDFDRLYISAFALNRLPVADPKALPASQVNTESAAT